jgi:hypothetical protein
MSPKREPKADPGRALSDHPVQRTVPANSVFQAAQQAAGKYTRHPVDLAQLKVYTDRPLPPVSTGRGAQSEYARIYAEVLTKPGMSVDLTPKQAKSFISWGKKNGKHLATRALGPNLAGIWRLK